MAEGGGIGVCKLAPRLLEEIMTGLWSFGSLNQGSAASIDPAHDGAARCWLVYSGEECSNARSSPGQQSKSPANPGCLPTLRPLFRGSPGSQAVPVTPVSRFDGPCKSYGRGCGRPLGQSGWGPCSIHRNSYQTLRPLPRCCK